MECSECSAADRGGSVEESRDRRKDGDVGLELAAYRIDDTVTQGAFDDAVLLDSLAPRLLAHGGGADQARTQNDPGQLPHRQHTAPVAHQFVPTATKPDGRH